MALPSSSSNPTTLSEKELLDLIKNENTEQTKLENDAPHDVLKFISTYNLQPGTYKIQFKLLFALYSKWSKERVSRKQFSFVLGYYFETKGAGVLLNRSALAITKDLFEYLNKKQKTSKSYKKQLENFIEFYSIQDGTFWIDADTLYYLYDKWAYDKKLHTSVLNKRELTGFLKVFFKYKDKYPKVLFSLSKTILNHITKHEINQIQEGVTFRSEKSKKTKSTK
jgi:hypothetical protein